MRKMTEVSKQRPCPVCGHDHACKFLSDDENQGESIMCLRIHDHSNIFGADGKKYSWSADSRDGGWSIFRPYKEKRRSWHSGSAQGSSEKFIRPSQQKEIKKDEGIPPLPNDALNKMSRYLLSKLVLDKRHREYLIKQGWTDLLILKHQVKSFPEADMIRQKYGNRTGSRNKSRRELAKAMEARFGKDCLRGFPGAYQENGEWTFAGPSGIIFPMYDTKGNIFRLRLRMDWLDLNRTLTITGTGAEFEFEGEKYEVSMKGVKRKGEIKPLGDDTTGRRGKYRTLSSYALKDDGTNAYPSGCRSANEASLYTMAGDDMSLCYIVEGEPKSIYSNYMLKAPVISVPGVNSYDVLFRNGYIDAMAEKGTTLFVVAYDADKNSNQMVLDFEKRICDAIKEKGYMVAIADWEQSLGKGLDDLLAGGHAPTFRIV